MARQRLPRPHRHLRTLPVRYGRPGQLESEALTHDVSAHGLCLISSWPVRPGTRLELEVSLGDTVPVRMNAFAMWSTWRSGQTVSSGSCGLWLLDPPPAWRSFCHTLEGEA